MAATLRAPPADVPARAFPFRISVDDCGEDAGTVAALLADGAATVVRLPLRETRTTEEIAAHVLETIHPEALIFLPFANELALDVAGNRESWRRTTGRAVGAGRLVHLTRDAGRSRRSWLVARSTTRVGRAAIEALEDPLWTGLRELEAAVALPWNRRPDPARGPQRLHVYFPTDDTLGRPLLLHGDFYVDSSRRHIETLEAGGAISRSVAAAAAKLTADLAESVAGHGRPLLECLAETDTPSGFGREIGTLLDEALRRARIARPADGTAARRPDQLRGLSLETVALERALLPLLGRTRDLLAPDDYGGPAGALLERLGTEWLEAAEVAARIDLSTGAVEYAPGLRAVARFEPGRD